jgi:hypothetical protein
MTEQEDPRAAEAMQHALDVQEKYREMLMAMPGVIGIGVGMVRPQDADDEQPGLVVLVGDLPAANPQVAAAFAAFPSTLDGVPVALQHMGGGFHAQA